MPIVKGDTASLVIDVEAVDNYSDVLAQINKNTATMAANMTKVSDNTATAAKKSTNAWTEFRSMYSTVLDVVRVGQQVWSATVDKAQEYDQTIKDVMLSTGATAEASSRLVQVVDDAGVSYGTLKTAMKNASKDGIEPNIASLQMLSDQYLKLAPGVERNQFLLDKFGKSGLEMARVMELGGSAIAKMNAEIDGGLVLTQKAIDESERYRKNVDDLEDAYQSLKVTIGNQVIPVTSDLIEHYQRIGESLKENGYWYTLTHQFSLDEIEDDKKRAAAMDGATTSYTAWAKSLEGEVVPAVEDTTVSLEELTKQNSDYLSTIGDVTQELDNQKQKLDEVKEKYGEGSQEYADATAEFEQNTHRRILAMLEEQLSVDGLSEKESTFLLEQGVKWGIYSEEAIGTMAAIQRQVDAMERNIDININVHTNYSTAGQEALTTQLAGEKGYVPNQHAAGGSFMIPMAYGNEGFRMGNGDTASGGEMVTISPRGQGNGSAEIVAAIERNRTNEDRLVQLFETAIQRVMK